MIRKLDLQVGSELEMELAEEVNGKKQLVITEKQPAGELSPEEKLRLVKNRGWIKIIRKKANDRGDQRKDHHRYFN